MSLQSNGTQEVPLRQELEFVEKYADIQRTRFRKVKEMEPWFHGDYVVRPTDGQKLTLSRSHRARLLERLSPGL